MMVCELKWEELYFAYGPAIKGLCRRYVRDENIAEDMMHDTFITAMQKYESFLGTGSVKSWLSRIAINTSLQYLKREMKNHHANLAYGSDEACIDEQESVAEEMYHFEFKQEDLLHALDQLPLHHKTVFNLYVFDGYKHHEIADALQISTGTSKSHLARARKKLQDILVSKYKEMKKRKSRVAWIPLFTNENHPIDKIFRDGLAGFAIPPDERIDGGEHINKSHPSENIHPLGSLIHSTGFLPSLYIGISIILCGLAGVFFYLESQGIPELQNESTIVKSLQDTTLMQEESISSSESITIDSPDTNSLPLFKRNLPSVQESLENISQTKDNVQMRHKSRPVNQEQADTFSQPVVIRKKMIKRDTVIMMKEQ